MKSCARCTHSEQRKCMPACVECEREKHLGYIKMYIIKLKTERYESDSAMQRMAINDVARLV